MAVDSFMFLKKKKEWGQVAFWKLSYVGMIPSDMKSSHSVFVGEHPTAAAGAGSTAVSNLVLEASVAIQERKRIPSEHHST